MKKFLLSLSAFAFIASASAQTYNFFDPADCDAEGWLWLDSQEKFNKYVSKYKESFDSSDNISPDLTPTTKILLLNATFENDMFEVEQPVCDPTIKGYNAEGVQGGEGSWTGAIILPGSKNANGSDEPNGGGFAFYLPDCAEFALKLSTEPQTIGVGLKGSKGSWPILNDFALIQTYYKMGIFGKLLAQTSQFTWNNAQDVENANTNLKLASEKGTKVAGSLRNNRGDVLLVQAIKIFTYTQTEYPTGSGVADIEIDNSNAPVEYFNMQGVKVANPENGLYIRRQGSKVEKIML